MKNVLIIYWDEDVHFIEIQTTEIKLLKSFNNQYVNTAGTDIQLAIEINKFFYNEDGEFKFDFTETPLVDKHYDLIIITGQQP